MALYDKTKTPRWVPIAVGALIIGNIILVVLLNRPRNQAVQVLPTAAPSGTQNASLPPIPTPLELPPVPTGSTFTSNNVTVRNFFQTNDERDSLGITTVSQTTNYVIFYDAADDSFLISITGAPFETNRQAAEQALLTELSISQSQACQLRTSITTPDNANPAESGKSYPLSFCEE